MSGLDYTVELTACLLLTQGYWYRASNSQIRWLLSDLAVFFHRKEGDCKAKNKEIYTTEPNC